MWDLEFSIRAGCAAAASIASSVGGAACTAGPGPHQLGLVGGVSPVARGPGAAGGGRAMASLDAATLAPRHWVSSALADPWEAPNFGLAGKLNRDVRPPQPTGGGRTHGKRSRPHTPPPPPRPPACPG